MAEGSPQAQENSLAQDAFAIARPFSFCCQHGLAVTEGIRSQTIHIIGLRGAFRRKRPLFTLAK
jgi:hypothetical protein